MELKVWVLAGALAIVMPALGYLLVRELTRKDQLAVAVQELNKAVTALTVTVESIRAWSTDKFVDRDEYREDRQALKESIQKWAERFEKDMENCAKRCPRQ
jgi:outer membrane murein-binding lipoprotein Lpp